MMEALAPHLDLLRHQLDARQCAALLVIADSAHDPDIALFTGNAHLRRCLLIAAPGKPVHLAFFSPLEREEAAATRLRCITPEQLDLVRWEREIRDPAERLATVLEQALWRAGVAPGRLALAGHAGVGEVNAACRLLQREGWSFDSGHDIVLRLRKTKTVDQLRRLRRAATGTMAAFRQVAEMLTFSRPDPRAGGSSKESRGAELWLGDERLTVSRLRGAIAMTLAAEGLEQPEGNIVAPAEEGAVPHNAGSADRVIRVGETLIVDLFPGHGVFADCTRTFCVPEARTGKVPAHIQRAHDLVLAALRRAHLEARPGVRGWDLQEATCRGFEAAGFATALSDPHTRTGYVHGLGHGVGLDVHEFPSFRQQAGEEGVLDVGDVFTLEPGLYDPEAGYAVRLEDLVWLGPEGVENLTPLPYELDPRAWVG